jgi:glycosyltransferase involved in cell wall biosynthesis
MSGRRKRILFLIRSLYGGGAERSLLNVLANLDRNRFEPHLVLWWHSGAYLDGIPEDVSLHILQTSRRFILARHIQNMRALVKVIENEQADVLLSFLDGSNVLSLETKLIKKLDCAFVISQRNNMSLSFERRYEFKGFRRWLKMAYVRWLYPKADHIISLSRGVKADLVENFGMPANKITPIHNPIDIQTILEKSLESVDYPWDRQTSRIIIAVGRLFEQKGLFDLVEAFSQVESDRPVKLVILGEGELRRQLEDFIISKELNEHVWMPGFVENPWAFMRDADVFVLSSHWEGFGNVIVEAMACGTPVIATDCDYGPREIIHSGEDGILVPVGDVEGLAREISRLLSDDSERLRIGMAGKQRAYAFDSQKICLEFERVFEDTLEKKG